MATGIPQVRPKQTDKTTLTSLRPFSTMPPQPPAGIQNETFKLWKKLREDKRRGERIVLPGILFSFHSRGFLRARYLLTIPRHLLRGILGYTHIHKRTHRAGLQNGLDLMKRRSSIGAARSASRPIYRVLQTTSIKGPLSSPLPYFSFHRSAGLHAA